MYELDRSVITFDSTTAITHDPRDEITRSLLKSHDIGRI